MKRDMDDSAKFVGMFFIYLFIMLGALGIALFPTRCAHARDIPLKYGQCITVGRNRYCAPAKNVCPACPKCPAQKPCPSPKPCPSATPCPTAKPCPTQAPCPKCPECPSLTNDGYWYAIASMFLACGSEGTGWNLPANSYVSKLMDLSLGEPTMEITTHGCYLKYWVNALVILNPQDTASCAIPLDGAYKDVETGSPVTGSVTVLPKRGKVLVK